VAGVPEDPCGGQAGHAAADDRDGFLHVLPLS
jgi:hypothetical protein